MAAGTRTPSGSAGLPGSESDEQLLARAVADLVRRTRFPVAFGGLERDDSIYVTSIVGARTRSLDGLVVQASRGLGGRALVEKRPRLALDYRSARSITHEPTRSVSDVPAQKLDVALWARQISRAALLATPTIGG